MDGLTHGFICLGSCSHSGGLFHFHIVCLILLFCSWVSFIPSSLPQWDFQKSMDRTGLL